jgi:3-phosphoglycerate kinase
MLASHVLLVEIKNARNRQHRRVIREDRKFLEARVRRFLSDYLSATDVRKNQFYEVVVGASAGCHPEGAISHLENIRVAEMTAESANAVVQRRVQMGKDSHSNLERFITDAYATTALAYRRAAGTYVDDERMQQLGTAAVHLLTIANSAMAPLQRDG